MRFRFPYPVKPWHITQAWGIYNPAYQRFGFDHHNGTDVLLGENAEIRAPFAGKVVRIGTKKNGTWQPNGGGVFISIISDETYQFDDGLESRVLADFLHCDHVLRKEGDKVGPGFMLAIADNTGFSTGPHTHIQLRRVIYDEQNNAWFEQDQNNANGSFDPTPYYTNTYVIDDTLKALTEQVSYLHQLFEDIKAGFNKRFSKRSDSTSPK